MMGLNGVMLLNQAHQYIPSWDGVKDQTSVFFLTCMCFLSLLGVACWHYVTQATQLTKGNE